jgi:hypothetical protein
MHSFMAHITFHGIVVIMDCDCLVHNTNAFVYGICDENAKLN